MTLKDITAYTSPCSAFSGYNKPFEEADFVVIGAPYDGTSTFRAGSRFGPQAIREASMNIETYSVRSGLDVEDLKICDVGDLHIAETPAKTLERLTLVVNDVAAAKKIPVVIGGEHTLTMGAVRAFGKNVAVLDFDAHMDLRDEYMGSRLSHTTFMRRLADEIGSKKIVQVGVRAICKDDRKFAEEAELTYITANEIRQSGSKKVAQVIEDFLSPQKSVYLTVDADVLDPAYAPAVGNPEPDGLSTTTLLDILQDACNGRIVGFDLVEVAPHYDSGITAVQAAKIIFEIMCYVEKARKELSQH
ncbi:MAG TPA: agmatinase [archaeon]|nr:agmatinase [archaeon]